MMKAKEAGTFAQPQAPNLVKPIPVSTHTSSALKMLTYAKTSFEYAVSIRKYLFLTDKY